MKQNPFPYAYWVKILGGLIIVAGVIGFFIQHHKKGVYDLNELAVALSWGLVFIFFSKEKISFFPFPLINSWHSPYSLQQAIFIT